MKLSQLAAQVARTHISPPLAAIAWPGNAQPDVDCLNITDDSRQVAAGSLFIAVRGDRHDGHAFIPSAAAAGAAAIIAQRPPPDPVSVPVGLVADSRAWLSHACAAWAGLADLQARRQMRAVGVTGTNGKSTTAFVVQAMLAHAAHPCAMIGTVLYDLVGRKVAAPLTTPPPLDLSRMLAEAATHGAAHVVMETSSHSLDQRRVDGVRFDVGVFTNLTGDHLDYHGNMRNYLLAKKRLFDMLPANGTAVVNADDDASEQLIADCAARLISYSIDADAPARAVAPWRTAHPRSAMLTARIRHMTAAGAAFDVSIDNSTQTVNTALIGRHNVQNLLAAIGAGLGLGLSLPQCCRGVEQLRNVRGRLERVNVGNAGFCVVVDYAHTDDALRNVLSALRPLTNGRLTCVFGCGGDRDRTKRPRMARVAAELADDIIVTSDNPRTESPQAIIADIRAGFSDADAARCACIVDRRSAIRAAISAASPGDTVLIAGKGHEDYQIVGTHKHHFDDVEEARAAVCQPPAQRPYSTA